MCGKRVPYRYTIERQIPGTKQFIIVKKSYPYKSPELTGPMEIQFLTDLCNNQKDMPIKFGIRKDTPKMEEINSVTTTITELEGGNNKLVSNAGSSLFFLDFELIEKQNFTDYLSG